MSTSSDDPQEIARDLAEQLETSLDVDPVHEPDEYRRGQKRGYLDAACLIRRAFGLPTKPRSS